MGPTSFFPDMKQLAVFILAILGSSASLQGAEVKTADKGNEEWRTPLYLALENRDQSLAEKLLRGGADPNEQVSIGGCKASLLHVAAALGEGYVAEALVRYGADLYSPDCRGLTALHRAIEGDQVGVIESLGAAGFDVNRSFGPDSETPLFQAVRNGNLTTLQALLQLNSSPNVINGKQETPLLLSVHESKYDFASLLLKFGAKIDFLFQDRETYVHKAARLEDLPALMYFLDKGLNVDALNQKGETPLSIVVSSNGLPSVASLLLNRGAGKNKIFGETADTYVHLAIKGKSLGVLRVLLQHNVPADNKNARGKTPIVLATEENQAGSVSLLIEYGTDINQKFGPVQASLLHVAVSKDSNEVLRTLLEHGLNADVKNEAGRTPISEAVRKGSQIMVSTLADHGADLSQRIGNDNDTLLHLAVQFNRADVLQTLLQHGLKADTENAVGVTPIVLATANNFAQLISVLVNNGADINQTYGTSSMSLLHMAVEYNTLDSLKVLLERGAKVDPTDSNKKTPILVAVEHGQSEIVLNFANFGSDLKQRWGDLNRTLLHEATQRNELVIAGVLLDRGAQIDALDKYNWTPLHIAAGEGFSEVVALLLERSAPTEAESNAQWTPLHWAAYRNHTTCVELLLQHGAKPDPIDVYKRAPLHLAAEYGYTDEVRILLDHGADVNRKTYDGRTPLQIATEMGHKETADYIKFRGGTL